MELTRAYILGDMALLLMETPYSIQSNRFPSLTPRLLGVLELLVLLPEPSATHGFEKAPASPQMAAAIGFFILMDTDATAENHMDFHNSTKQQEQMQQQNMDM
jgi:hypothetical protein